MTVILPHEKKNFRFSKPTSAGDAIPKGDGISDIISSVGNIVSKNKDLISSGAKAISSVSSAANKIADTVKKSNQLKELQMIRELHNKRLEAAATAANAASKKNDALASRDLSESVKDKIRESKGSGFTSGSGFKIIE